jgi:hypothetical protein
MKLHLKRIHDITIISTTHKASSSSSDGTSKQPKLSEFMATKAMMSSESPKAKRLTNNIVKMICLDLQPLSMVEDSGFRSLMSEAEPRFVIPTRKVCGTT